jgi:hypothetical protein
MIRDYKAARGNERTAPARIETDARFLQMIEPLWGRLELIFLLELLEGRVVEEPHSLVREDW